MALEETQVKKPWFSKQIWLAAIVAAVGFVPGGAAWVASNSEIVLSALGGLIALLRVISKGKIAIGE